MIDDDAEAATMLVWVDIFEDEGGDTKGRMSGTTCGAIITHLASACVGTAQKRGARAAGGATVDGGGAPAGGRGDSRHDKKGRERS